MEGRIDIAVVSKTLLNNDEWREGKDMESIGAGVRSG